jgi:hypothetical protein
VQAHLQRAIESSLVSAIDVARVEHEPFAHLYLRDVFPADVYAGMLEGLPGLEYFRPDNPAKYGAAAKRLHAAPEGGAAPESCRYTMPLDEAHLTRLAGAERGFWTSVSAALRSEALKARVFEAVADDLCRRFGKDARELSRMEAHPRATLIRDLSGYWIAPHPDSRAKIVTVQFYLARDESQRELGTTLYRRRLFHPRVLLSLSNLFVPVRRLEFLPNSGYVFPVGRRSWHGREEVPAGAGERNSILLVYYRDASREW